MLGEFFIDQSLSLTISLQSGEKQSNEIFESIYYVLNWFKKETPKDEFPIEFRDKYELALYAIKYRMDQSSFNIDEMCQGLSGGRFESLIPILKAKVRDYTDEERSEASRKILKKRKLCASMTGLKEVTGKLNDINAGIYDDDDEVISLWEDVITKQHTQILDVNKIEALENVSYLDLYNDDFNPVMSKLREQSDFKDSVKTGFQFLYDSLPAKGFEPCRFYLVGGTSGVGKSTILINCVGNAVLESENFNPAVDKREDVLLYITAENLIDETLERLYCQMTGIPISEIKKKYKDITFSLKPELMKILSKKKLNVQIYYVQPKKTTVRDIEGIMDKVLSTGLKIRGVYLDYLDLFRSGFNLIDLRHELGEVAVGFKNLAVTFRVPIITVTQLNRAGYNNQSEASLTQMSESMQKIDNADFVLFLQNDKEPTISIPTDTGIAKECKHIKMSILKNRNGPVGNSCQLIMQERMGSLEIFNFKMEEKSKLGVTTSFSATPAATSNSGASHSNTPGGGGSNPWAAF